MTDLIRTSLPTLETQLKLQFLRIFYIFSINQTQNETLYELIFNLNKKYFSPTSILATEKGKVP